MRVVCFGVLFLFVILAVPLNAAKKIDPEKFRGTLTTSQGGGVVYYRLRLCWRDSHLGGVVYYGLRLCWCNPYLGGVGRNLL